LTVLKGVYQEPAYTLDKPRTNPGRLAELTDAEQRVIRCNHVVFEEDGDYRICDDGSEFGTRIFREGRTIDVPSGNRRGEKLRPGNEIYLGRARPGFER
jgi:hypothetical protein